jgi:2-dehydropantoate 2-reductase
MRFLVIGAGAIGGILAGFLARRGGDVVLVPRESQAESLRTRGLRIRSPDLGSFRVKPHVTALARHTPGPDDVVFLCVKSFDTPAVVEAAAGVIPPETTPVFCFQNGVRNEEMAARRFRHVHGGFVSVSATCLAPGEIEHTSDRRLGVGRWPRDLDHVDHDVADRLEQAGFIVGRHLDIQAVKWGKCLINCNNAVLALTGQSLQEGLANEATRGLMADVLEEGIQAARAAGQPLSTGELKHSLDEMVVVLRTGRHRQPFREGETSGGPTWPSTWQDLHLRRGRTEVLMFNGEVEQLGRAHGVATPLNAWLRREVTRRAVLREPPGGLAAADIRAAAAETD